MKKYLVVFLLTVFAIGCTNNREAQISEMLKTEVEQKITKDLGKAPFTDEFLPYYLKQMQVKLVSYDESSKTATVELTTMNQKVTMGMIFIAALSGGKAKLDDVLKEIDKDKKTPRDPHKQTLKCVFEEKDGKEQLKSCS